MTSVSCPPTITSVKSLALSVQQSPCKYAKAAADPSRASPSAVSAPASAHLGGLLMDLIKHVNILVQGTQNWMQCSRCILTSVKSAGYSLTDRSMNAF